MLTNAVMYGIIIIERKVKKYGKKEILYTQRTTNKLLQ